MKHMVQCGNIEQTVCGTNVSGLRAINNAWSRTNKGAAKDRTTGKRGWARAYRGSLLEGILHRGAPLHADSVTWRNELEAIGYFLDAAKLQEAQQ
jgi:hypothetical protein